MDNLFNLMLLYLLYLAISLWLFNFNAISPSIVFFSVLSVMLSLAYYSASTLGLLFAINIHTFIIFATGGFVFLITELLVFLSHSAKYKLKQLSSPQNILLTSPSSSPPQPLLVNWQVQIAFTIFAALSLLLALYILRVSSSAPSLTSKMTELRDNMMYHPERIKFRFIAAQIYKINFVFTYLFSYIMIYNSSVCNVPFKNIALYVIDAIIYFFYSAIATGARQLPAELLLFICVTYVSVNLTPQGKKKIFKFIIKIIPIILFFAASFSYAGQLVGRTEKLKSSLQLVSEYMCGGLYAFNLHVNEPASSKIWGQSTFAYVYSIPQNLGLMPRSDELSVTGKFELYGNTLTIFGRWYKDFGTIGTYVMTCIVSLLYSLCFYNRILYSNNIPHQHHLSRIYYGQFMIGLIWAGYDDRLGNLLTVQTIVFLFLIYFLFDWLVVKHYKLF